MASLIEQLLKAIEADEETYHGWRSLVDLAGEVLKGNIDAYFEGINKLRPLDDLLECGVDFEFGSNSSDTMHVECLVGIQKTVR